MRRAIELARCGVDSGDGGPFGAVVARDGEILGEGWNRVVAANDPTAHGEINAIRAACTRIGSFSLAGCEIFTTGEPCPMCLAAIHWARLDRVVFACSIEDSAAIGFDDAWILDQVRLARSKRALPSIPASPEIRDAALAVARAWLDNPDRRRY